MPTKTQRILANLPSTFQPQARGSALRAVVDAFGGELLAAENSLAALMRAHWVDHADRGAPRIDDLARIAALYGLAPRPDEGVEEFREHLKRYVRTFLEGTVTVQGILRVSAEALGLRLRDAYEELDTWWTRPEPVLVTSEAAGEDAAELVLGTGAAEARGSEARPARVVGEVDLSGGTDLGAGATLRLRVDDRPVVEVDLSAGAADPARATLDELAAAIDGALGFPATSHDGAFLTIVSPTVGAASKLEVLGGSGDAAPAVFGLATRSSRGSAAEPARLVGRIDLAAGVDLSERRYLRVRIDGDLLAEVDCAGPDPAATTLDQVRDAVNAALGAPVASHDGHLLTLTSTTSGFASQILLLETAAQDARRDLLGEVEGARLGRDAESARLRGRADLSAGVDLSAASRLRLRIDGGAPVTVDVAGEVPAATGIDEIARAIDAAAGVPVASHDGAFLTLTSPTQGPSSRVTLQKLATGDAAEALFGISPRVYEGADATAPRLTGPVLATPLNLWARHLLRVALDDGEPVTVDLTSHAADRGRVRPEELAEAVNAALGAGVATAAEGRLVLRSPMAGPAARLRILPLERFRRRRFVTRAAVEDEAALPLFGFVARDARGEEATAASIQGTVSLVRGADLRERRYLRLEVDGAAAFEADCAGPRPRATTLQEVVTRINDRAVAEAGSPVATTDGRRLRLASPTRGAGSRLRLLPTGSSNALEPLGLAAGTTRGRAATGVRFVGTADLSAGIDLPAGSALRLGVDGGVPVEVPLAPEGDEHSTLARIATAVNVALGVQVASHDGRRLVLTCPSEGSGAVLEIAAPAGLDATGALLGIPAPRTYRGADAAPARVTTAAGLPPALDLSERRFLRLGADGAVAEVDLAAAAADPAAVTPAEVAAAIAAAEGSGGILAELEAGLLVLTSPTAGFGSRVVLEPSSAGDARSALLGDAPGEARGRAPAPAVIEGGVPLLSALDLASRRRLRLSIDGGAAFEVDVAGASPEHTMADEVVAALDALSPGLASVTADDRLRLVSPTAGAGSRLRLLPRRSLELEEYPPVPVRVERPGRHATRLSLRNGGAAAAELRVTIHAHRGGFGFALTDLDTGAGARVLAPLAAGERLRMWRAPDGAVGAQIDGPDGGVRPVEAGDLVVFGDRPLELPRGASRLLFRECRVSRFDEARLDRSRFAGGVCTEWGVFGASRFAASSDPWAGPGPAVPVFAPSDLPEAASVGLRLRWLGHLPGRFQIHLPADLPARFGGRFGGARFGGRTPELFAGAVTEPPDDPDHLIARINAGGAGAGPSALVHVPAEEGEEAPGLAPRVPLGWEPAVMPFREPRHLILGDGDRAARIYLGEAGLEGFVRLEARAPGEWGNRIAVTAREAGPGRYDVTVAFAGAPFENARRAVLGDPLPAAAAKLLLPGAVGVLQAKAAGVEARVSRDRARAPETDDVPNP